MNISKYSQPSFYKFNSDSIELIKFAVDQLKRSGKIRVLDICSGCGIIGIEFSVLHGQVSHLTLIEIQSDYKPHLIKNLDKVTLNTSVLIEDFKSHKLLFKHDVILCNPPYFKADSGRVSPNEKRQLSRTFKTGDLEKLLDFGINALNDNGVFLIVHREDISQFDNRFTKVKEFAGASLFRFVLNKD